MKRVTILGSTGSIGTQALDVIDNDRELFQVKALTCGYNAKLLSSQINKYKPDLAACLLEDDAMELRSKHPDTEIISGRDAITQVAAEDTDIVLNALTGISGLLPTMSAIIAGHDVAIANKETIVAAGDQVMEAAGKAGIRVLPVDSEHSAIFQCMEGNKNRKIRRILLTASGGPFRGKSLHFLRTVKPIDALKHPNWSMGRKVTIDSATMMNKGLEIIEASRLFGISSAKIQILVHPQSIVHSAVEYEDGSIIAQMGKPDMRIPISLALGYPDRLTNPNNGIDFFKEGSKLTFEEPDRNIFACLRLAEEAAKSGGSITTVMNAANEVTVRAFLNDDIDFLDIPGIIERIMDEHSNTFNADIEEIIDIDKKARIRTTEFIKSMQIHS